VALPPPANPEWNHDHVSVITPADADRNPRKVLKKYNVGQRGRHGSAYKRRRFYLHISIPSPSPFPFPFPFPPPFFLHGFTRLSDRFSRTGEIGNTCTRCGTIDNKRRSAAPRRAACSRACCARKIAQRPAPSLLRLFHLRLLLLRHPASPASGGGTKSITPMNAVGTTHRG